MSRCTICHTRISESDSLTDCSDCEQQYHAGCWTELGGCATYGCASTPAAEKPAPVINAGSGWGDTKTCPACSASIGSSRLICSCGAKFPHADPMDRDEYSIWRTDQDWVKRAKRILVAMFIGSIVGVTAPLCGLIAAIYGYKNREKLAGEHGTFLALAAGSATLGVTYSVIFASISFGL